jgi:alpha-amylase/alpha-mannosidase (GH57 family)
LRVLCKIMGVRSISRMKNAFIAIHGHFYQPPRENPWFEFIETEESAHPFHDWNERIALECYRPNAHARILDEKGKILEIVNNYSSISFNFGPTLLPWLEKNFQSVYQKILEADREGLRRFGYGNAIGQVYNHIIMPLANERDKETEVLWGMADFEKRFHRKPEAMWLPETAVNISTLQVLVKYGMRYLILSPFQASRVRPFGGKRWTDVSQGRIDSTQPYRCFIKDASGKKLLDQFIDIFFYNGMISKEIAFGDLLKDGNAFSNRFAQFYQESKESPQLIHIATDGETYGHHKKFGDMALAYALEKGFPIRGFEVINHGAFLKRFPPVYEVEIDEGPKGEGSSWSCAHGVGRWKEDCGCSTGGKPGWNQRWRKPLREALDLLRDELSQVFEKEGEKIFKDVWEARNGYIEVILNRSPERIKSFFERYGFKDLDEKGRIKGVKLLEMQRHALQMYTSCGWFFADLAGLETILILQHAARAIQLAEELTGQEIEKKFLARLSEAESNLPEMGNGDQVYQRLVKPRWVTPDKVVNHFAISSLFDEGDGEKKIFSYRVEKIHYEKMGKGEDLLVIGQVKVTSEVIPESKEFLFGLISSKKEVFRTWVSEVNPSTPRPDGRSLSSTRDQAEGLRVDPEQSHFTPPLKVGLGAAEWVKGSPSFDTLKEKGLEVLGKGGEEMTKFLTSSLGNRLFTIQDTFKEERQMIFQKLIQKEFDEHCQIYADLFDRTKQAVEALSREGLEIPYEIRVAAEVTLSHRLFREIKELKKDLKATKEKGEIDRIIEEAKEHGYHLRMEKSLLVLNEILMEKMNLLQESKGSDLPRQAEQIDEVMTFLDLAKKWDFEISLEEAQNLMGQILDECVGGLEKCWWEDGTAKPFSPNLITLAEKLGFNVERFLKITG